MRIDDAAAVPFPVALSEDVEVVAVQVHGVRGEREVVVHNESDRRVGAEIVHVFGHREFQIARFGAKKCRRVVVDLESDAVHVPDVVRAVVGEPAVDGVGDRGIGVGGLNVHGDLDSEGVLVA